MNYRESITALFLVALFLVNLASPSLDPSIMADVIYECQDISDAEPEGEDKGEAEKYQQRAQRRNQHPNTPYILENGTRYTASNSVYHARKISPPPKSLI